VKLARLGLRPQLVGLAVLSIAVGLGATTFLVHQAAIQEINLYSNRRGPVLAARAAASLGVLYSQRGMRGLDTGVRELAALLASPVELRTPAGQLLLRAVPPVIARHLGQRVTANVVTPDGRLVAIVTIRHIAVLAEPLGRVTHSLDRAIWIAALVGFVSALVLSGILGERILNPIRRIAEGARQVGSGGLAYRVVPSGPAEVYGLAEDFNRMAGKLETSLNNQRQLIADVAHELRTPLAVLTGYLEAAWDGVIVSGRDPVQLAQHEARVLARLIDDLQELALAESQQLLLRPELIQVDDLVRPLAEDWVAAASQQGIELITRFRGAPVWVEVDPSRMRQVLTNLLANAVKYTPPGGHIELSVESLAPSPVVRIAVRDDGPGIPLDELEHIFERLYRVDRSRAKAGAAAPVGGFGLGLAIAKSLVEMQQGTIGARPAPDKGVIFFVDLPVRHPERTGGSPSPQ
jgi:signal transduction histidine kinase